MADKTLNTTSMKFDKKLYLKNLGNVAIQFCVLFTLNILYKYFVSPGTNWEEEILNVIRLAYITIVILLIVFRGWPYISNKPQVVP